MKCRIRIIRALVCASVMTVGVVAPAQARLYQWTNEDSGATELSGTPPGWYRNGLAGPRVFVFENGRLIDDTASAVSEQRGQELREAAFSDFDERQQLEAVKRLERLARREAGRQQARERAEAARRAREAAASTVTTEETQAVEALPDELDQSTIDRLKSIIERWDRQ